MQSSHPTPMQMVRRCLAADAADVVDALATAGATTRAWTLLFNELTPLIGPQGMAALYARNLRLVGAHFPWLGGALPEPGTQAPLAALQDRLAARPPVEAHAAGAALLESFIGLLGSLIGEPLTHRLLRSAWGDDRPEAGATDITP